MNKKRYGISMAGVYLGSVIAALGFAVLYAGFVYPSFNLTALVLLKGLLIFGGGFLFYMGATTVAEGMHTAKYWRRFKQGPTDRLDVLELKVNTLLDMTGHIGRDMKGDQDV